MQRVKLFILSSFVFLGIGFYLSQGQFSNASERAFGGTLAAPTNVLASDGDYSNKVGLHWDAMRDATTYRIFRNTTNDVGSAVDVGTTAANYFFDTTAIAAQNYYYWVRSENLTTTSGFSSPDIGIRANGSIIPGEEVLEPPPAPAGNPITAAKAYLGKTLFWDEQMSSTRTVACGTCHRPASGGSDPRTEVGDERSRNPGPDGVFGTLDDIFGSPGVPMNNVDGTYVFNPTFGMREQVTRRKAPSYIDAAYSVDGLFWDGRALGAFRDPLTNTILLPDTASLESQSVGPPVSAIEMGHINRNWTQVAARIQVSKPLAVAINIPSGLAAWIDNRTYPQLFEEAFGTPDVTPARIAMAIATHERTLFSDRTPLDRQNYGIEPLTAQEEQGRELFVSLKCNFCHTGPLMTDHLFHNIGVRPQSDDPGRLLVTFLEIDRSAFKNPNLRNVELRGPFMHNGGLSTIEDVVDFYDRGGDFPAPNINIGVIRPLNLTSTERASMIAFLKRPLTDARVRNETAPFDRPKLYTESNRMPVISGRGRPGAKFTIPEVVVIAPPIIGNPNFTVGITKARGGEPATLVIGSQDPGIGVTIPTSGSFAYQTIALSGEGIGAGYGSVNLAIPNDPLLIGQTFYGRWYVRDLRSVGGFSVSKLFTFTVF
ncbi:MAG: cytochrome c peroxidase [Pyrinomonadaceae bacterium]